MPKFTMICASLAAILVAGGPLFQRRGRDGRLWRRVRTDGRLGDLRRISDAVRLIDHRRYTDAIPHLASALAERPRDADILNYLGYTHRMIGDYRASLDDYRKALAIDPDHKGRA